MPHLRFSDDSLFPEAIEGRLSLHELKALTRRAFMSYYLRPAYIADRLRRGELHVLGEQLRLFWGYLRA
jgi:hypothetical protein